MRKAIVTMLLVVLVLGSWGIWAPPATAQTKPLAVMSFSGYDQWKSDIAYVGRLSDNPELAVGLEALLKLVTKSRGLEGLDKTRPWGAVVQAEGDQFTGCGFLPVTDLKALLEVAEMLVDGIQSIEQDGDVWHVETEDETIYVQQKGTWAFMANDKQMLAKAPGDPMEVIGDLNEQYDMAVRIYAENVPQQYRELFLREMNEGAAEEMERKPGEDEAEYVARRILLETIVHGITQAVEELEEVTLGWALDSDVEKTYLDVTASARPGTDLADKFSQLGTTKTNFAGFKLPGAALTANWAGKGAVDAKNVKSIMDVVRKGAFAEIEAEGNPEDETQLAKELVGDVLDVIQETVIAGRADGGMSVIADPQAVTLVAGSFVGNGKKLESVAKRLAELVKAEEPQVAPWIKIDADRYRGVNLHLVSIPIPPDADNREKAVQLIGETLDVVVGMSNDALYLAAGRDAVKTLKRAIARSAEESFKTAAPIEMELSLHPVAKFVAAVGDEGERENAALVASVLEGAAERDHVKLTVTPIERGARLRFELEEGILRLIGKMSTMDD
jgi:hypothetical protein